MQLAHLVNPLLADVLQIQQTNLLIKNLNLHLNLHVSCIG